MMRRMAARCAAVVFLVVASSPVCAQEIKASGAADPAAVVASEPAAAAVAPVAPAVADNPTVADRLRPVVDTRLLAPAQASAAERPLVHQPAYRRGNGVPLMIVGGAMFLAGAIIDDRAGDAVMVAGVVVAAIGLLQYLQ